MNAAEILLDRLEAVRQVGYGRWRARCPAHDGTNGDVLSIGEASDGTLLVKCFAGCSVVQVVRAVGLELRDLFPNRDADAHAHVGRQLGKYSVDWAEHHHPYRALRKAGYRRPRVDWPALIIAAERDLLLVKIMLATIARGEPLADGDMAACRVASERVLYMIEEARHA